MPRLSVYLIRTALLYLAAGFTFGGLMLFNKGLPFAPALWLPSGPSSSSIRLLKPSKRLTRKVSSIGI